MNSFLQSLYATHPFRERLLQSNPHNDFEEDPENFLQKLQFLFQQMRGRALNSEDSGKFVINFYNFYCVFMR